MKQATLGGLAVLALLVFLALGSRARAEDGRRLFLEKECNECHSIETEGIVKLEPKEEPEEEEEDDLGLDFGDDLEEDEDDTEPPDLSGVGKRHDADWMSRFVRKKVRTDEGKRHKKLFKGSDEELREIVAFLSALQKPAPSETDEETEGPESDGP